MIIITRAANLWKYKLVLSTSKISILPSKLVYFHQQQHYSNYYYSAAADENNNNLIDARHLDLILHTLKWLYKFDKN